MRRTARYLLLAIVATTAATAGAQSYYVDPSGVDTPPPTGGSPGNPFKTISFAVTWAVGGAVDLHLGTGVYNTNSGETFPIVLPPNTTISATVPWSAFVATDITTSLPTAFELPAGTAYAKFSGLDILGKGDAIHGNPAAGDSLVIQLDGCRVRGGAGIRFAAQASQVAVIIDDSSLFGASAAIRAVSKAAQVQLFVSRSRFTSGGWRGIDLEAANGGTITTDIELTSFAHLFRVGMRSNAISPGTISHTLQNCVFFGCSNKSGVAAAIKDLQPPPATTYQIDNTVFWANDFDLFSFGAGYTVRHCLMRSPVPGVGNISGDPLFVDGEAGDFHVRPLSPVIDAGLVTTISADIDGDPVPGSPSLTGVPLFDIGVDEFYERHAHINPDPIRMNLPGSLHLTGPSGTFGALVLSATANPAFGSGYQLGTPFAILPLAMVPASGTIDIGFLIQYSPALVGFTTFAQAGFHDPATGAIKWSFNSLAPEVVP